MEIKKSHYRTHFYLLSFWILQQKFLANVKIFKLMESPLFRLFVKILAVHKQERVLPD